MLRSCRESTCSASSDDQAISAGGAASVGGKLDVWATPTDSDAQSLTVNGCRPVDSAATGLLERQRGTMTAASGTHGRMSDHGPA